jgi:DNA-binding MarR family transcriptional regulator
VSSKKRIATDGEDLLQLGQQLCFPLYAATNLLQRLYRPLLEPLGLTYSQYLVMLLLWEKEPVSVGGLCDCLHLDLGTLSPLLKRMERSGFITRRRDVNDERRVLIALTTRGHALRADAAVVPKALATSIGLQPGDVLELRGRTQEFVTKLVAAAARPAPARHLRTPPRRSRLGGMLD